jgi:oxepin-CoA hydrolase/3-oxo-5,6-dehydrosuberyl-CoA semialdehyde dehydrogenase
VFVPRRGAAVHVNAFNFPAWGLGEKAACALLAGMPVVAKPSTSTALVAHRIVQLWVEAGVLPEGVLQLVVGAPGDLIHHLAGEDVLSFTGGGSTAAELRALAPVVRDSVRINVEADSLNAAVLGPDVELGSDTFLAFVRDVTRDITQKSGQKCTAIRRVLVPRERLSELCDALVERLSDVVVGDPASDGVTMGPVSTAKQLRDVRAGIERLRAESRCALGEAALTPRGVPEGKGFFVPPTLLVQDAEHGGRAVHEHEVFGPVATLIGYASTAEASELVRRGGGGLVTSLYTDDRNVAGELTLELASAHGRLVLGSAKVVEQIPGPGTVLPQTIHGGPGRAGGG